MKILRIGDLNELSKDRSNWGHCNRQAMSIVLVVCMLEMDTCHFYSSLSNLEFFYKNIFIIFYGYDYDY